MHAKTRRGNAQSHEAVAPESGENTAVSGLGAAERRRAGEGEVESKTP